MGTLQCTFYFHFPALTLSCSLHLLHKATQHCVITVEITTEESVIQYFQQRFVAFPCWKSTLNTTLIYEKNTWYIIKINMQLACFDLAGVAIVVLFAEEPLYHPQGSLGVPGAHFVNHCVTTYKMRYKMAASLPVINIMTCYKLNLNVSCQTEVLLNLNTNLALEKLDWTAVEKKGISKFRQIVGNYWSIERDQTIQNRNLSKHSNG